MDLINEKILPENAIAGEFVYQSSMPHFVKSLVMINNRFPGSMHSECYDITDEPSGAKSIQFVTPEVVTVEVIDSILCQKFADDTEEADGLILRRDER